MPAASTPTGTVTFVDQSNGNATLGTGTIAPNGKASIIVSTLSTGSHSIVATYNGDTNFEPLQMTHTRWRDDFRAVVPNRALAYGPAPGGSVGAPAVRAVKVM